MISFAGVVERIGRHHLRADGLPPRRELVLQLGGLLRAAADEIVLFTQIVVHIVQFDAVVLKNSISL